MSDRGSITLGELPGKLPMLESRVPSLRPARAGQPCAPHQIHGADSGSQNYDDEQKATRNGYILPQCAY
jgi:hypothetical protein